MKEKRNERFDKLNAKMEELTKEVYETTEAIKARDDAREAKINENIEKAKAKSDEIKANIKTRTDSIAAKGNENLNKLRQSFEDTKAKIMEKKEIHDKEKLEKYIDNQLDYVDQCVELSLLLQAEAKLAFLEAVSAEIEYKEKYGE